MSATTISGPCSPLVPGWRNRLRRVSKAGRDAEQQSINESEHNMRSFAAMHNDYLEPPDDDDNGYSAILEALKQQSTNRWRWDRIHCCWTGKDADLEPWGNQGVELETVRLWKGDLIAVCTVHASKTLVGTDVSLNVPDGTSEADENACHALYMEQAEMIVCGSMIPGEWDSGSWAMSFEHRFEVPANWQDRDGEMDGEACAAAIIESAKAAVKDWEREIVALDDALSVLAGWGTMKRRCKAGKPGKNSVWKMHKQQNSRA